MEKENQIQESLENVEDKKTKENLPEEKAREVKYNMVKKQNLQPQDVELLQEDKTNDNTVKIEKPTKKQEFFQFLKFLAFSLSAGVIQLLSFELLYTWTKWLPWWPSYLISIVLSVIWNFTFNRKFTFKSASNVPLAMILVLIYYCAFVPISVFGGDALEEIGWNGTLVTVLMMVINFITEFFWDKYIVFNDKIINKILRKDKYVEVEIIDENKINDNKK